MLEAIAAIQGNLKKLNECLTDTSVLKFQKDKYKVLHLGQDILTEECRLRLTVLQERTQRTTN